MKRFTSKELTFDFQKCVHDINNASIIANQTSFRNIGHKVYIVKK